MKRSHPDESRRRLEHILHSILLIEKYTAGQTKDSFVDDDLLHNAVLYQFSVIGEAIIHVDERILKEQNYPWHRVRTFRNLIAHEYFNIKPEAVWQIIVKDLPDLKLCIERIIEELRDSEA
jgi:uncharacterized protein with HEPN domain